MNCNEVRALLDLGFGGEKDGSLARHLAECAECSEYQIAAAELAAQFAKQAQSPFTPDELEQAAASVDLAIDQLPPSVTRVTRSNHGWLYYLPRLAAVFLLVAVSYISYQASRDFSDGSQITTWTDFDDTVLGQLLALDESESETDDEMDDELVSVLIADYVNDVGQNAAEWLLDDLTDEELKYLESNFEARDLL